MPFYFGRKKNRGTDSVRDTNVQRLLRIVIQVTPESKPLISSRNNKTTVGAELSKTELKVIYSEGLKVSEIKSEMTAEKVLTSMVVAAHFHLRFANFSSFSSACGEKQD